METAVDQTAEILAMYGTPEQRRDYALMDANRIYREARIAAHDAYLAAGGSADDLASPKDQTGEPLYEALKSAIQDAAEAYSRRRAEALETFRTEMAQF